MSARRPLRWTLAAGLATVALALAGCAAGSSDAGSGADAASPSTEPKLSGTVTIFAAASLTEVFGEAKTVFEKQHPGVEVVLNFGGSSALAEQILSGAPADVFAAASPATMTTVTDGGAAAGAPKTFATNTLEIAVPKDNPGKVTKLADFADASRTIAICAPEVPCGAAAVKVFQAAGITAAPDTLEQDVKGVLTKVSLGEADAGLVYRTDVLAAGADVKGIPFDEAADAVNDYPIAVLKDAPSPDAAKAFVDWVLSDAGQKLLAKAGFGAA
ncbi:molybdate ABC transporter substrate-binding protein [Schumannella luteola]|uniref:Molybdate transport system substrate-binding protein n=1 Tax=Schumannella luteola TaxID=472059 RepID=A0A852Y9I4_9MICO|nr:molybdate transport system substrate-binding protein [Schumannella luteola]TPX06441.1 molybdate ABC transporter substrate-binding protein [Schumannella luteola]